jgi:hypothetical protein
MQLHYDAPSNNNVPIRVTHSESIGANIILYNMRLSQVEMNAPADGAICRASTGASFIYEKSNGVPVNAVSPAVRLYSSKITRQLRYILELLEIKPCADMME